MMFTIRAVQLTQTLRASVRCFVAIVALGLSGQVAAQLSTPGFEIVPAVAAPGVARQVSVSLHWPLSCLPTGATVLASEIYRKRTVVVRIDSNGQNFIYCDDLVNHKITVTVTPEAEGDVRVLVVRNDGTYLGETTIRTRAAASSRSQYDLTGMWYDPTTHGSGLTFLHGFTRDDVLFGTWYVYDATGAPRWYTIQSVQWKPGGLVAEGQIYETRASSVVCLPPFTGCPVAFATILSQSQARIVMQGPNNAQIQAIAPNGTVFFTSNIVRSVF